MAWLVGIVVPLAALVTLVWGLVELFDHWDKQNDPKFRDFREGFGLWLTSLTDESFSQRVSKANEFFFHWFDALFHGKGTLLEQGLWLGLLFSPVMLLLLRLLLLVTGEQTPQASRMLLLAMTLAFVLSIAVVAGKPLEALLERLSVVVGLVVGLVLGVVLSVVFAGVVGVVVLGVVVGVVIGVVIGVFGGVLLGVVVGVVVGVVGGVLVGVLGGNLAEGLALGLGFAVGVALGSIALQLLRFHLPVHPLRSMALSLVTLVILGAIMQDATISFYHLLLQDGPIVLSYVAFNLFADGISLLETRWVLRRSLNLGLLALLGLVLLDLVLSAVIFLALPLFLGELPSFWESIFFQGSRPWLGILFWSTFSTSLLFYLFVGTVVLLITPGHALARLFHRTVGSIITIESRPFTAIAYGMILLLAVVAAVGSAGTLLYRLVAS